MSVKNKIEASKVKKGDIVAMVSYAKVDQVFPGNKVVVVDLDNNLNAYQIDGKELIENLYSADQFASTKYVSKFEAAELLTQSFNVPMTVNFTKVDGTVRTMRCKLQKQEPLMGRSYVEDLEESGNHRIKQVDHRSLHWMIVNNVKYVVS